jgi:RHS repeat-associated protein
MWAWHYDGMINDSTGRYSKHVYLNESRIVTKIARADGSFTNEERIKQYYYHSDHLGSAQLISNADGEEYERIEYTPYGELWIEKASTASNIDIPFRFTGKERDEETGLYYYGARYLDARTSRWLSTDPALGKYMGGSNSGLGGIYNTINFHLYHYAGNNPIKYTDPDGRAISWDDLLKGIELSIPLFSQTEHPDALRKFSEFINDGNAWFLGIMGIAGAIYGLWEGFQTFVGFLMDVYSKIKEGVSIPLGRKWQFNIAPNFDKKGIDINIKTNPNPPPKEPNPNDLDLPKIPPENDVPKSGIPDGQAPQNETNVTRPRKEEHIET